jgi:flagellar biosynthesis/type III secretory pathway protein FliH
MFERTTKDGHYYSPELVKALLDKLIEPEDYQNAQITEYAKGHDKGYQKGYDEGYDEGYSRGRDLKY